MIDMPSLMPAACVTLAFCAAGTASAQGSASADEPPIDRQIAAAVLPLPEGSRAAATVMGYRDGKLTVLRKGTGAFICLGDNPATKGFQASCYHNSLEPFMARGRSLRELGITKRAAVDSARRAEVREGTLAMPSVPAALASIFADSADFDPAAGPPKGAGILDVIYIPYATGESTGIPEQPKDGRPWLMYPGEPWAHVMISR
jgi:hypothetical protein